MFLDTSSLFSLNFPLTLLTCLSNCYLFKIQIKKIVMNYLKQQNEYRDFVFMLINL